MIFRKKKQKNYFKKYLKIKSEISNIKNNKSKKKIKKIVNKNT